MYILRSFRGIIRILKSGNSALKYESRTCFTGGNSRNVLLIGINKLAPFTWTNNPCGEESRSPFSSTPLLFCQVALSQSDLKRAVEALTDQFMEARELLEDARESTGTVYFSADMEEASEAVEKTLEEYKVLIARLSVEQKQEVQRTIGLKMEELKAHQQLLHEES